MPLLRDNATGKLMRDSATSRLMRRAAIEYGANCEYCTEGETPKEITLTVSGLSDCLDCFERLAGFFKTAGIAAALNDNSYVLYQDGLAPCWWERSYTGGNFGTLTYYPGYNCTGTPTEYTINQLHLHVNKCAPNGLIISLAVMAWPQWDWYMQAFAYEVHEPLPPWRCKTAVITDCIAVQELANTWPCEGIPGRPYSEASCEGGVVSIVEGPL